MSDNQDQPFDLGSALARIGNIPTQDQLGQAAQDEGAAYRGRLAQEQPQAPENPTFNGAMIEPITPLSPQSQPPYDYSAANLESGRNLSNQSFVDSYNKQTAAEPRVDPLNRIASSLAGRPVTPYNANPSNYRQLTPSEEAEKYRSEQSEYAGLAAGIATPELASATGLARFAPGPNQLNMFLPARDFQKAEALTLEQQGVHPDNILRETGAFRDVDGRWVREISDASSRVTPEAQQFIKDYQSAAGPATDVFEHPELYKQAPGLKKYQMELEQEPEFIKADHPDYFPGFQQKAEVMEQRGYSPNEIFKQSNMVRTPEGEWTQRYFPLGWHNGAEQNIRVAGANPEDFRKVILHESSHAVDKAMGRPSYGANDDRIYQDIAKLPKEEVIARAQASHAAGSPWAPNLENYKDNWEGFLRQQASDEYMRNAAEARARNVETRRNMSQAERLNTHPFKTMDIPPEQQIVGYETTPGSKQASRPTPPTYGFKEYADQLKAFNEWDKNNLNAKQLEYDAYHAGLNDIEKLKQGHEDRRLRIRDAYAGETQQLQQEMQDRLAAFKETSGQMPPDHAQALADKHIGDMKAKIDQSKKMYTDALNQMIEKQNAEVSKAHDSLGQKLKAMETERAQKYPPVEYPRMPKSEPKTYTPIPPMPNRIVSIQPTEDASRAVGATNRSSPWRETQSIKGQAIKDVADDEARRADPKNYHAFAAHEDLENLGQLADKDRQGAISPEHFNSEYNRLRKNIIEAHDGDVKAADNAIIQRLNWDSWKTSKPPFKSGGSVSDKTYALLHRIKKQGGGQVNTEEPLYDPNPIPSHYSPPKERLQPDDPNFGNFRAIGSAFKYNVPPDARKSSNIEDRRFTHPSLPTSDFGNYNGPMMGGPSSHPPASPSSAAGIQGMSGTQSGPSATRATLEPWSTTNITPITRPPEPSWTPPPVKALLQPSMLRNFDSYAPEFGSGRASFDPLMQPSLARGGTVSRPTLSNGGSITDRTRQLLAKLKNRA